MAALGCFVQGVPASVKQTLFAGRKIRQEAAACPQQREGRLSIVASSGSKGDQGKPPPSKRFDDYGKEALYEVATKVIKDRVYWHEHQRSNKYDDAQRRSTDGRRSASPPPPPPPKSRSRTSNDVSPGYSSYGARRATWIDNDNWEGGQQGSSSLDVMAMGSTREAVGGRKNPFEFMETIELLLPVDILQRFQECKRHMKVDRDFEVLQRLLMVYEKQYSSGDFKKVDKKPEEKGWDKS